ncbi:MAG: glycoside hydrolase family 43 protein [Blastocatellia bacterium]
MRSLANTAIQPTYLNPVYPRSCPDPFVLKCLNEYWLYCTGFWRDGRCFGILHSRDLTTWRELGGAMEAPDKVATCYWAPEVWYENGVFLMYYSVGNEERMQIRVARSDHPAGPFVDCGVRLTTEEFAIDAHIFEDDDGSRWMFYATDFLTHTRIGTGTVCDRMIDAFTLAGEPRPVTRALFDWQVYDPRRIEKGGVRWHTVEGPFVLKRKGLYYQMFSGGNWKNETYGVSYAISENLDAAPAISSVVMDEWRQVADGEIVRPILRTVPGEVIGPGHNSVVRGPDNQQLFCVYHRWLNEEAGRALAIDRLDWAGQRMLVIGPSMTPQPAPIAPAFADYFDGSADGLGDGWKINGGKWVERDGMARQELREEEAEALCSACSPYFVAEVSLRVRDGSAANGAAGIKLMGEQEPVLFFNLNPQARQAVATARIGGHWVHEDLPLPPAFDFAAFHLLRAEVNASRVTISIDRTFGGAVLKWEGALSSQAVSIALTTTNAVAEFAGFALTHGWQDLFDGDQKDLASWNWRTTANDDRWRLSDDQLCYLGPHGEASILTKGPAPEEYELVVNAKLIGEPNPGDCYGFLPVIGAGADNPVMTVEKCASGWAVCLDSLNGASAFSLPSDFDAAEYQQFRFRRQRGRLTIQHEARVIGEIESTGAAGMIGLYGHRVIAAFDMVRVTAIGYGR